MYVWVNAKLHVQCPECWQRWNPDADRPVSSHFYCSNGHQFRNEAQTTFLELKGIESVTGFR